MIEGCAQRVALHPPGVPRLLFHRAYYWAPWQHTEAHGEFRGSSRLIRTCVGAGEYGCVQGVRV
jgi:hypothetical protein